LILGIPESGSNTVASTRPVRSVPASYQAVRTGEPWKISAGRYRRFSPHSEHSAMIHVLGIVATGAGMF